jgi:hypothetical protein
VREVGRIVGGEEWQEKVYNREEWKKFLRIARTTVAIEIFNRHLSFRHHLRTKSQDQGKSNFCDM